MSSTLYPRPPRPIHVPQPLCLLCSSSILLPSTSASSSSPRPILTKCCQRTICVSCQTTKGRIARWDPCLACEGGWKTAGKGGNGKERESDFVLGDEEDEDEEDEEGKEIEIDGQSRTIEEGLDDASLLPGSISAKQQQHEVDQLAPPPPPPTSQPSHHHHLLLPTDTLLSLSLHYRLDPHHLCTLNNLPFSTIHTTPHLLHTRTHLLLLPSPPPPLPASIQAQKAHERALARFARVTKEQDPLVRRTYVGLAEEGHFDEDEADERGYEEKKSGTRGGGVGGEAATTEGRAVGRFFEDAEWERENEGGGGRLRGFPVVSGGSGSGGWKSAGSSASQSESRGDGGGSWWSGWGSGNKSVGGGGKEVGGGVKVG